MDQVSAPHLVRGPVCQQPRKHRLSALNIGCSVYWGLSKQKTSPSRRRGLTWSVDTGEDITTDSLCGTNAACLCWDLRICDCGIRFNCHLCVLEVSTAGACRVKKTVCSRHVTFAQICTSKCDFKWDTIYSVASFSCPGSRRILASEYSSCVCIHLTCYCNRCFPQIKCEVRNMSFGWRIDMSYLR